MRKTQTDYPVIAHVLPWPNIGGTERQTLLLARCSREANFINLIYYPAGASAVRDLFSDEKFLTFEYDQIQPSFSHPKNFLYASAKMAASLRRNGVSILHCSDILSTHFTGLAGRYAGAKVVSHVRNYYPQIPYRDQLFLRTAQQFTFVSVHTRDSFAMARARQQENNRVLYDLPGVPYLPTLDSKSARLFFGIQTDGHVFGMAARFSPQKDFPTLIRAAQIVTTYLPNSVFLVAGDHQTELTYRQHFESLQPLLEDTGMRNHFVFAGFQKDMSKFYSAIDTFVLSSHWEGLPTVVLETVCVYRKPVVCTDVGGVSEAIENAQTGFLTKANCPDELAKYMLIIADNLALRDQFTKLASCFIEQRFGERRFRAQVRDLYLGVSHK